jgi:peptidylprolyl isomerase
VGSEKRDRQKQGRQARAEAELAAARAAKRRRTLTRAVIGAAVVLGAAFAYSQLAGGDDDDGGDEAEAASEDTTPTTAPEPEYANPELAEEVLAREAPDPEPPPGDTPADAVETETLIEGEGTGAAAGDQVTVHYVGKVPDGTVFDESWSGGQPFPVALGQGQVIPGWDEGLVGATIGERRRLVIGADNAYGAEGRPDGGIPADSPLAFEVDIVDIQPGSGAVAPSIPAPEEAPDMATATTGTTPAG